MLDNYSSEGVDLKQVDPQAHNPEECRLSKATAQTILTAVQLADKFKPNYLNPFESFRTQAIMIEILDSDTEPFNERFPWHGEHPPVTPSSRKEL